MSSSYLAAKSDAAALEQYCRYFVRWRACEEFVPKNGISYQQGEKASLKTVINARTSRFAF